MKRKGQMGTLAIVVTIALMVFLSVPLYNATQTQLDESFSGTFSQNDESFDVEFNQFVDLQNSDIQTDSENVTLSVFDEFTLVSDDFNRADNLTLGNFWDESSENVDKEFSVLNNQLQLNETSGAISEVMQQNFNVFNQTVFLKGTHDTPDTQITNGFTSFNFVDSFNNRLSLFEFSYDEGVFFNSSFVCVQETAQRINYTEIDVVDFNMTFNTATLNAECRLDLNNGTVLIVNTTASSGNFNSPPFTNLSIQTFLDRSVEFDNLEYLYFEDNTEFNTLNNTQYNFDYGSGRINVTDFDYRFETLNADYDYTGVDENSAEFILASLGVTMILLLMVALVSITVINKLKEEF